MTKKAREQPASLLHVRPPQPQAQYALPVAPSYPYDASAGYSVQIRVLADPGAVVAEASFMPGGGYTPTFTVTGNSKRDNTDGNDADTGREIAVGRALLKMGHRLLREANGRVAHQAAVQAQREQARAKALAAQVTDSDIDDRLQETLGRAGFKVMSLPYDNLPGDIRAWMQETAAEHGIEVDLDLPERAPYSPKHARRVPEPAERRQYEGNVEPDGLPG